MVTWATEEVFEKEQLSRERAGVLSGGLLDVRMPVHLRLSLTEGLSLNLEVPEL